MQQKMGFEYAIFITPPLSDAEIFTACTDYRERYLTYQVQQLNTFEERLERFTLPMPTAPLACAAEWLSINNPLVQMSLCKPGENAEIVLRLFNPGPHSETFSLMSPCSLQIGQMSLRDEKIRPLSGEITLNAGDYLTLSVTFIPSPSCPAGEENETDPLR